MSRIFVTGASGFIGGAAARGLTAKHAVSAMARSDSSARKVEALGATAVRCDLETIAPSHLAGCDTVVHCAAYAEEWGTEKDFFTANVRGTANLLLAARAAGVSRFIFIGTEAALFHGQDMEGIDESYPYALSSPYPYSRTKAQAEKLVLAANAPGFATLSLRPRMVWGPDDQSILPAVLEMVAAGKFAWIGGGAYRTSTTHVANLVHAIELALTRGAGGEAYFIANDETVMVRDFLGRYLASQGVTPKDRSVPRFVARLLARAVELAWRVLGLASKPPMVRFSIDIMSAHCVVNTAKARRELGYAPVISTEEGLRTMPRISVGK